jgi:cytochrome c biogenesis protein ResB
VFIQGIEYYMENYPDIPGTKVLGVLSYQWILSLQLDHIYTANYFYLSLSLLAASLMACTYTRQLPTVKVQNISTSVHIRRFVKAAYKLHNLVLTTVFC